MRSIRFSEVFGNACQFAGRDASQVSDTEKARMCGFINNRVRHGWDFADWPELRICEERYFRDAWSSTTSYAPDDTVWNTEDSKYYTALTVNTNSRPDQNASDWEVETALDRYIPWIMADCYPLGTVYQVSRENPFKYADRMYTYAFTMGREGAWVHECVSDSVWIIFRPRASRYTMTAHATDGSYSSGDLVYMSVNGEVYQAGLVAGVQTWVKVEFPEFLASYVAWAAAGDWMLWNGERERADRAWAIADKHLEDLCTRELGQTGQSMSMDVKGHW